MKCSICGRGIISDGVSLFRNGPKGENPDWRCEKHLPSENRDDALTQTVAEIESIGMTKH